MPQRGRSQRNGSPRLGEHSRRDGGPRGIWSGPRVGPAAQPLAGLGGPVRQCSGVLRVCPTAVPIPGSVGQLVTQGALVLALLLALLANPRRRDQAEPVPGAADHAGRRRADGQHPQRVHAGVDLPRLPAARLRRGALAAHPVVGEVRLRPAPRPSHVPAHRARHRAGRRGRRPGRGVLLRGSALGSAVADSAHPGGPLRGRPARVHRRAVVRRSHPRSDRLVDACRGGGGPGRAHTPGPRSWP